MNEFLKQLRKISKQCQFEVVNDEQLDAVGLEKEDIKLPEVKTGYSAGADFYSPVDINLVPGGEVTVATGVKAHCAPCTMLCIYPRSSLGFKNYVRLANTVGIIDADYYGNKDNDGCIFVKIRNEGKKELKIKKGEAFCQGVFQFYIPNRDHCFATARVREGGIGSTSIKEEPEPEKEKEEVPVITTEKTLDDGTVVKTWSYSPDENTHYTVKHVSSDNKYYYSYSRHAQLSLFDD